MKTINYEIYDPNTGRIVDQQFGQGRLQQLKHNSKIKDSIELKIQKCEKEPSVSEEYKDDNN